MDAEFGVVNEKITNILAQVIKTNSRVTHNEKDIVDLKIEDKNHIIHCPVAPKLEALEDELLEYKMFKKYPKIFVIACGIFTLISIAVLLAEIGII